jgi:hypothetical protein
MDQRSSSMRGTHGRAVPSRATQRSPAWSLQSADVNIERVHADDDAWDEIRGALPRSTSGQRQTRPPPGKRADVIEAIEP